MTIRLSKLIKLKNRDQDELINAFKEIEKEILVAKRQIKRIEYEVSRLKNHNKIGKIFVNDDIGYLKSQ